MSSPAATRLKSWTTLLHATAKGPGNGKGSTTTVGAAQQGGLPPPPPHPASEIPNTAANIVPRRNPFMIGSPRRQPSRSTCRPCRKERSSRQSYPPGSGSVLQEKRHTHVHAEFGDFPSCHNDFLFLDPGSLDPLERLRGAGDPRMDRILETLRRRCRDFHYLRDRHSPAFPQCCCHDSSFLQEVSPKWISPI